MPKAIKPYVVLLAELSASSAPTGTQDEFLDKVWPIIECAFTKRNERNFRITNNFIAERSVADGVVYAVTPEGLETDFNAAGYVTVLTGAANKVLRVINPF
jgi:hypothetical protein